MTAFWLAFTTPPQKEREAQKHLRELGLDAYVPVITLQKKRRRTGNVYDMATAPVMPGYVFVEFPVWQKERYHTAKESKFVRGVILVDGKPGRIPYDVMCDFVISLANLKPSSGPQFGLHKGSKARVSKGKFAELDVMILFVGQTKSKIQVQIFGSDREALIENSQLQPSVSSTEVAANNRKQLQKGANQVKQNSGRSVPSSSAYIPRYREG